MSYEASNFAAGFARFDDHRAPRVIAEMNDYRSGLARVAGDSARHAHADTDEAFIVLDGELTADNDVRI